MSLRHARSAKRCDSGNVDTAAWPTQSRGRGGLKGGSRLLGPRLAYKLEQHARIVLATVPYFSLHPGALEYDYGMLASPITGLNAPPC